MYDLARFPTIVVAGKPISHSVDDAGAALGMAASGGMASVGRMLSAQIEISNHTAEGLIQFLHFRTSTTREAFDRSRRWWGRWYNKMSGQHPIYVQLRCHHLIQSLNAVRPEYATRNTPQPGPCAIRATLGGNHLSWLAYTVHGTGGAWLPH